MKYLFLGIIQGLTEFLPISSSGHLVILKHWMNLQEEGVVMEVTLHFATLLAIIIFFRKLSNKRKDLIEEYSPIELWNILHPAAIQHQTTELSFIAKKIVPSPFGYF